VNEKNPHPGVRRQIASQSWNVALAPKKRVPDSTSSESGRFVCSSFAQYLPLKISTELPTGKFVEQCVSSEWTKITISGPIQRNIVVKASRYPIEPLHCREATGAAVSSPDEQIRIASTRTAAVRISYAIAWPELV
jgi:hypothetical protein